MRLLYVTMAHLTFSYGNDEAEFLKKVKIADNLSKAGWSWACVSAIDVNRRTIWIADAHRGDGKRFVVPADEKLTAFMELDWAKPAPQIVNVVSVIHWRKTSRVSGAALHEN
jgi:hypothetical protein